uniref:PINc domain-containing protein n=1 Tax=Heterorhabditis bacteriophora TaxID=37862 RepID=A0A1I7XQA1_HETBA
MTVHLCTPKSLTMALARRETIYVGNYLRENANMTPKQAQHTLLKRARSNLHCVTDDKDLLLLDYANMIVVRNKMLWMSYFTH